MRFLEKSGLARLKIGVSISIFRALRPEFCLIRLTFPTQSCYKSTHIPNNEG
jgi:hypothetical protein